MDTNAGGPAIYVIGAVAVDMIMGPVAPWPLPGTETFVTHSEIRAGGPAGNTALALQALKISHRVICNVGSDVFGRWLTESFGDQAHQWDVAKAPTTISVAIEHPGGERSFITAPGNLEHLTADGILAALPAKARHGDIALFTGVFLYPKLLASFGAILGSVGKRGYKVALDTGWPPGGWSEEIKSLASSWLAHCDHVLLNEIESQSISDEQSITEAAKWLAERAKPGAAIIIKRGANGASAWQAGITTEVPAPKVRVVDTTGAGDAFNAGYLAACLRGVDISRALQEGIEIASAAIASSPRHYSRPEFSSEKLDSDAIRSA
jgi:sugar/nucleoside kinase (ribokinase family)